MKVKATRLGYYNHKRRREGEVFELLDGKAFSERWMVKIGGETPKSKSKVIAEPEAQSSSEEVI